jgi:15-cis-phytoene synthase
MNSQQHAACRELMRGGSKSFFLASRVLPARVCAPATALYAFCRVADDLIDHSADAAAAVLALSQRLDAVYAGAPGPALEDQALAGLVAEVALPRVLLEALLEGFAWDAQGRSYDSLEALHAYAARVAGAVGAMMALVMETRDPVALARACELGVAMQLSNIARDVADDARLGRVYLPLKWLHEEGLSRDDVLGLASASGLESQKAPAIARVTERLLQEADRLYARAECGVQALPRDCRPAIHAARLVYAEIGQEVRRLGTLALRRRAVVSHPRKLALLLRASTAWWFAPGAPIAAGATSPPLPAVHYLVQAAASSELPKRTFYQRTVRMLELFERQAERSVAA